MHARRDIVRTIAIATTLLTACDPARLGTLPSEQNSGESGSSSSASAGDAGDDAGGATSGVDDPTVGEDEGTSASDPTTGGDGNTSEATTGTSTCEDISICDPQPNYLSQARVAFDDAVLFGLGVNSFNLLDTPCVVDSVTTSGSESASVAMICEGLDEITTMQLEGVPAEVVAQFTIGRELLLDVTGEQLDQFDGQSSFARLRDLADGAIVLAYGQGQQATSDLRLFPMVGDARDEGWYGVALAQDDDACAPEPVECGNILLDSCADSSSAQRLGVRFDDTVTVVDAGEAQLGDLQLEVAEALRTTTAPECPRSVVEVLVAQR